MGTSPECRRGDFVDSVELLFDSFSVEVSFSVNEDPFDRSRDTGGDPV